LQELNRQKKAALIKMQLFYDLNRKQDCLFRFHWRQIKRLIHVQKYFDVNHRKMAYSADSPQRQRPKAVLPSRPYTIPLESIISITFYFNGSIIIDY
jgi:hypothetical protein